MNRLAGFILLLALVSCERAIDPELVEQQHLDPLDILHRGDKPGHAFDVRRRIRQAQLVASDLRLEEGQPVNGDVPVPVGQHHRLVERARDAGAMAYLVKPARRDEILSTVRRAVAGNAALRA